MKLKIWKLTKGLKKPKKGDAEEKQFELEKQQKLEL